MFIFCLKNFGVWPLRVCCVRQLLYKLEIMVIIDVFVLMKALCISMLQFSLSWMS